MLLRDPRKPQPANAFGDRVAQSGSLQWVSSKSGAMLKENVGSRLAGDDDRR